MNYMLANGYAIVNSHIAILTAKDPLIVDA